MVIALSKRLPNCGSLDAVKMNHFVRRYLMHTYFMMINLGLKTNLDKLKKSVIENIFSRKIDYHKYLSNTNYMKYFYHLYIQYLYYSC